MSSLGYQHTDEAKAKISANNSKHWLGKKRPDIAGRISPMMGRKHSEAIRKKMSLAASGANNPNWQGGVNDINTAIRKTLEAKLWREAVFARDNYTCVNCGAKNGEGKTVILHADHIKPFYKYPELRFAIDNGRTLCAPCHRQTPTYGRPRRIA